MPGKNSVVVIGAARTPIGKFSGGLSEVAAPLLGGVAVRAAIERSNIEPEEVDFAIVGNVLNSGLGQSPARQAAIAGGLPKACASLNVSQVCASGMMAVILGTQMVKVGDAKMVVAAGMENMSQAPHVLKGSREGLRLGDWKLVDSMLYDGLWCCFSDRPMGDLAERIAGSFDVGREDQDLFALMSHKRAMAAIKGGHFRREISPVETGTRVIDTDEGPRRSVSLETLKSLKPAFSPGTTVTAGNSSQISDGAAAVAVTSSDHAKTLDLKPIAEIEDYTVVANDPSRLFEAPAQAISQLLDRNGMNLGDIDLLEINEAFAAQILANGKALEWDWDRVNVNGGAVALGHPIGATGTRILVTLLYAMVSRGLETGVAALCHGGGGAVAMRMKLV